MEPLKCVRSISLVVPVFNEEENIQPLFSQLQAVMNGLKRPVEAVIVDDGSTDRTHEELKKVTSADSRFVVVQFRKNMARRRRGRLGWSMPKVTSSSRWTGICKTILLTFR